MFLNNRYHDPQLGVFISVDPLVAQTGEPYLYGSANPTTLSDPSGLEAGCGPTASSGSCAKAHGDVESILTFKQAVSHTANEIVTNTGNQTVQDVGDVRDPSLARLVMWILTAGGGAGADGVQAGDQPLNSVVGDNSAADDFATGLGYEVDVGAVDETEISLYLIFAANIEEFYVVSLESRDPAIRCVSGACVGAG